MASTSLNKKASRLKGRARRRATSFKVNGFTPVIKKVDIEELKKQFAS
ncbi:hypothetical protein FUAX_10210 [Fulvitalea axinellae]|uniref:30S ribosomal protein S20 n=1 Tax=Fulvitalea axinellae TaxID=1182444 RepID=A0AAU9CQB6_9BACT|nr:hypothetical protein FUAX_10210 [Fulvitalea axinellae]